jgi:hypothetical protein
MRPWLQARNATLHEEKPKPGGITGRGLHWFTFQLHLSRV